MKIISLIKQITTKFNNGCERHTKATQPLVDSLAGRPTSPSPAYAYAIIPGSKTGNTKTKKEGLELPQFYKAAADNIGGGKPTVDSVIREEIINRILASESRGIANYHLEKGQRAYKEMIGAGASHEEAMKVEVYVRDTTTIRLLGLEDSPGIESSPAGRELNVTYDELNIDPVKRQEIINTALTGQVPAEFIASSQNPLGYSSEAVQRAVWADQMIMQELTITGEEWTYGQLEQFSNEVMAIFDKQEVRSNNNQAVDTVIEENARYFQQDYGYSLPVARKVAEAALYADEQTYNVILRINENETLTPQQKLEALFNRGIINDEDIDSQSDEGGLGVTQNPNPVKPTNPAGGIPEEPVTNSDPAQQEAQRTSETDTDPESTVSKSTPINDTKTLTDQTPLSSISNFSKLAASCTIPGVSTAQTTLTESEQDILPTDAHILSIDNDKEVVKIVKKKQPHKLLGEQKVSVPVSSN